MKGKAKLMFNGKVIAEAIDVTFSPAVTLPEPVEFIPPEPLDYPTSFTCTMEIKDPAQVKIWQENLAKLFTVPERIFFWRQRDKYGFMSNFYRASVTIDGLTYPTVEHYYQAFKAQHQDDLFAEIVTAPTPLAAKKLGKKALLPANWDEMKFAVMLQGVKAKFDQHPDLAHALLATGNALIYEDSPYDIIWGTGEAGGVGTGQNLLGQVLMTVRGLLAAGK